MQNTWFKNLDKEKIVNFLKNYFKENKENILVWIDFLNNNLGQKFIEVQTLNKNDDYLKASMILGDYFVLSPSANIDDLSNNTILEEMENFQDLNKKWIKFLYENNKNTKINNQTYKEYLEEKFNKSILDYYRNNIDFVISKYLKNEDGFTESATISTIKEFKKEYDEEIKNLPNVINALINYKNEENIK